VTLRGAMAPKKEKKKKEPPPPPSVWTPATPSAAPWVICDLGAVTGLRAGTHAVVRGKEPLCSGHFRLVYEVTRCDNPAGYGLLIGVCSCSSANDPSAVSASKTASTLAVDSFNTGGHAVAWALCPSTGKLVTTHETGRGAYDGATQGTQLMEVPMASKRNTQGMNIVIEIFLPAYEDNQQSAIAQRTYSRSLHPLVMRHAAMIDKEQRSFAHGRPSMAFSIDGGELIDAGVPVLPSALYPWVMLGREGDCVTLASIERLDSD